ncbi:MAG: hypothetical protein AAFO07_00940, partial [Bacteroidota bacterium]
MKKKKRTSIKLLEIIQSEQEQRSIIQEKGKRDIEPRLLSISNALDDYFIYEKLRVYCSFLSYNIIVHQDRIGYDASRFELMPAILELLEKKTSDFPLIIIFQKLKKLYEMVNGNSFSEDQVLTQFDQLEKVIEENHKDIPNEELEEIYSHLTNFAIYKLNNEHKSYLLKNLKYNLHLINLQEPYGKNSVINPGMYKNTIVLITQASHLNDFVITDYLKHWKGRNPLDWADFIAERYKHFLPDGNESIYYNYCKAWISFCAKDYLNAFERINIKKQITEIFINFDYKVLKLRILLELEIQGDPIMDSDEINIKTDMENLRSMLRYDKRRPKLNYQEKYFEAFYHLFRNFYKYFK